MSNSIDMALSSAVEAHCVLQSHESLTDISPALPTEQRTSTEIPSISQVPSLTIKFLEESRELLLLFDKKGQIPNVCQPHSPIVRDTIIESVLDTASPSFSEPFAFLSLPGEIRNKIYCQIYLSSRSSYDEPDFLIHGDNPKTGIRWLNLRRLYILLASRTTYDEFLAAISSLVYFRIKTYREPLSKGPSLTRNALERFAPLCSASSKVSIAFTYTTSCTIKTTLRYWSTQVESLVRIISNYPHLKDIELKLQIPDLGPSNLAIFAPVLGLAKKNGVTVVVLFVAVDSYMVAGKRSFQKTYEKVIFKEAMREAGEEASVWVEWSSEKAERRERVSRERLFVA